jgi:hypothetical protein
MAWDTRVSRTTSLTIDHAVTFASDAFRLPSNTFEISVANTKPMVAQMINWVVNV